jgi:uncharacterized protein YecE (DUF72 family)
LSSTKETPVKKWFCFCHIQKNKKMKYNIGCSGFSYKEWKGVFYPDKLPQGKWFEFYCEQFNTLELNVTFYRFPTVATLQSWYNRSPHDYIFSVKAPRLITHYKRLTDIRELLTGFYSTCKDGLKHKLGPVLFQFPKQFIYSEENLNRIISNLDSNFINVVEFRHDSWWNEEVYTQLSKSKIIFCGISHPNLPDGVVINNGIIYYRFHGIPKIYYSGYGEKILKQFADTILQTDSSTKIFCYFNNTAAMAALENGQWLIRYLGDATGINK